MKRILYIQLFLIISSSVFYSCDRELISSGYPNVATLSAEDQGEKIVFSGELKNDEDILIDEAGFIWQSSDDPVSKPGFQVKSEKPGSGNFSAEISWSVANDKNYVLRAYVKCGDKTVYGEKLDFKTALIRPCQLFRIEPDSAFRGDTIKFIGRGFNQTLQYNKVYIDGKNSVITRINDSILTCVVPVELTKGSNVVNIVVNGIGGDFSQKFKLLLPPELTDIDGFIYEIVTIGNQKWMKQNLKTTRYRDGSVIPLISNSSNWTSASSGAYCSFGNNNANIINYGALYNWFAVIDPKGLCPTGWHVPTNDELSTLVNYLGGVEVAGGKMKETGTIHWNFPNSGADNTSNFTALGTGYRDRTSVYSEVNRVGYLWSSTEYSPTHGIGRKLYYDSPIISFSGNYKQSGFSVRCIKD